MTTAGERTASGQVPIGPGWSLARMKSQVPGYIIEKNKDEGFQSPLLQSSSLQLQTGGLKLSGTSKKKVCHWSQGCVIEQEMLSLLLLMPSTWSTLT